MSKILLFLFLFLFLFARSTVITGYTFSNLEYQNWKTKFNYLWTGSVDNYRTSIFSNNLTKINNHNADLTNTYTMGINQFTAFTQ